MKLFFA